MSKAKPAARVTVRDDPPGEPNEGGDNAPALAPMRVTTPTEHLLAMSAQSYRLPPLRNGKLITLAKPGALAQFRLVKLMGQTAQNTAYMQMILPLIYVIEIDDANGEGPQAVPFPASEREVEALIMRLDEEGVTSVAMGVQKYFHGAVLDMNSGQLRTMSVEEMVEAQKDAIKK